MRFIVRTSSATVDSRNENGHLNSARNADGMRCSARGASSDRECMQMLHGNDALGLLPKLCGGKHTHTHSSSAFFKIFSNMSIFMYKSP